jgi:uncharacterized protein (TIGR00299 family) protein
LHIHLDPLGGIAGDMFVAALLDAFPEHQAGTLGAAAALAPVTCDLVAHRDHVLAGSRFCVREKIATPEDHGHADHPHAHWADIRTMLAASALPERVVARATGIFTLLAEAEALVHGIAPEDVAFHEIGAADSIADIVAASWLIEMLGVDSWSTAPVPLGTGLVRTAHGLLPVPAPATALLLQGIATRCDGVDGERVTPTGAAILRHLQCGARPAGRMARQGIGFGTRPLPGLSNCLRVLAFDVATTQATGHRELLMVSFEVDDQSGEDLAAGIARLREMNAVHDVLLMPGFGKKGRLVTHVQVLAAPAEEEQVVQACFTQTTTIGLRTQIVAARALPRRIREVMVDGTPVRVKIVERAGTVSGKAELDDVAGADSQAGREALRRRAEALAHA